MDIATNTAENIHDDRAGFYEFGVDEALERVDASRDGLSSEQASRRLDEHGPNQLAEQTATSAWQVALNQFTSPLVYVLLAALVITAILAKWRKRPAGVGDLPPVAPVAILGTYAVGIADLIVL